MARVYININLGSTMGMSHNKNNHCHYYFIFNKRSNKDEKIFKF